MNDSAQKCASWDVNRQQALSYSPACHLFALIIALITFGTYLFIFPQLACFLTSF